MEVNFIVQAIGEAALVGQGAEECCELAQALLKLQRIDMKVNTAAATREQVTDQITEEIADVLNLIELIEMHLGIDLEKVSLIRNEKMGRWADRLMGSTFGEQ